MREVLDLFSAAAGGWSLGMHRAGFTTIAACEVEAWRRALYSENNPGVKVYDDVRTLTADRLLADLGRVPSIVVGSPPCQDISSANTKGKGVEGERSGLYFEAIRIIGECRPRWFALENSANLRTRGADAVIAALEAIGYACWPVVVRAGDVGANHERPRCWLIGCDLAQVADADGFGSVGREWGRIGLDVSVSADPSDAACIGYEGGWSRGYRPDGDRSPSIEGRAAANSSSTRCWPGAGGEQCLEAPTRAPAGGAYAPSHAFADGSDDRSERTQMGRSQGACGTSSEPWPHWNGGLADHLRLDDGLSARLAGTRVDVGDGKGQSAASLIVEAFGDAVIPQIPEAIGKAILRTEAALAAIYGRSAA